MPYIKQEDKNRIGEDDLIEIGERIENCGQLNYAVTILCQTYLRIHGLNYQHLNDIEGALGNAAKEIYRRVTKDYENHKIDTNGDVNVMLGDAE